MLTRNILSAIRQLNVSCFQLYRGIYLSKISAGIVPFKLTDIGEGIAEVQIKEWFVNVNDKVKEFDKLCEVQSDKASVTVTSRYSGIIRKLHFSVDDVVPVGSALVDIETEDSGDSVTKAEMKEANSSARTRKVGNEPEHLDEQPKGKILATPAVRSMARKSQVDLQQVVGSGPSGRVTKEDILNHVENLKRDVPDMSFDPVAADYKVVPIRGYARAMLKNMTAASSIPHFTLSDEVNMNELVALKESLRQTQSAYGVKFTYMPFLIKVLKALSLALHKCPMMNALFDERRSSMVQQLAHNVCFAVDTPSGLVAPSVKNCERKDVLEIASEMSVLRRKAIEGSLSQEELSGGTITLSNIGTIGGVYASPVLLPPQVAIGAIGRIRVLPRYDKEKKLQPTFIMNVTWAADHRVLDGATVARFSNIWKEYIETPSLIHSAFR